MKASHVILIAFGLPLTCVALTTLQANSQQPNLFLGSLFPPGYTASANPATLVRQRGPIGTMKVPPDNSPIRISAAAAKRLMDAQPATLSQLGQNLFFDTSFSNPAGQSCASCHAPATGFSGPSSLVNALSGPVEGAVRGRFGNRIPPSIAYTVFSPLGPVYHPELGAYAGGLFWDGRTANLQSQIPFPLENPNEMNNILHNVVDPARVVSALEHGPNAALYRAIFGQHVFQLSTAQNMTYISQAIAAYESSRLVSPFSSKYDAYVAGKAKLTKSELNGLKLFTGSATGRPGGPANYKAGQCVLCHGIPTDPSTGPDVFSNFCYANIGVPKNPSNPYYSMTNAASNPLGYNALGRNYVDFGLGDFLYPASGKRSGSLAHDPLAINGTFKAPSLRNVDKRPSPGFVKAYMHNGVFKSLKDVVHFYNTRNLTTKPGEIIDFTKSDPYSGLQGKPLFPRPEFMSAITLQNPSGLIGSPAGQVGNLGLTSQEEDDIVAFLKTLTDGTGQ